MKLKKAIVTAQSYGDAYNWIVTDQDSCIFAYVTKPTLKSHFWTSQPQRKFIGKYTGEKCWDRTLRRVPKEVPVVY